MAIQIIIDQVSKIAGIPGESRSDLDSDKEITLSNYDNTGIESFKWELISWGTSLGNPNAEAPTLNNSDTSEATFTPVFIGSYLIQLTTDNNFSKRIIANIETSYLGMRLPAENEYNEFDGGYDWNLINTIKQLENGIENINISQATIMFRQLEDTPSSYAEYGGSLIKVSDDEYGLDFAANSFLNLADVPNSYDDYDGYIITSTSDSIEFSENSFLNLSDTPSSYDGSNEFLIKVKGDQSGFEFAENTFLDLPDTPSSYRRGLNKDWPRQNSGLYDRPLRVNSAGSAVEYESSFAWFEWDYTDSNLPQFGNPIVGSDITDYDIDISTHGLRIMIKTDVANDCSKKKESSVILPINVTPPSPNYIIVADIINANAVNYVGATIIGTRFNTDTEFGYFQIIHPSYDYSLTSEEGVFHSSLFKSSDSNPEGAPWAPMTTSNVEYAYTGFYDPYSFVESVSSPADLSMAQGTEGNSFVHGRADKYCMKPDLSNQITDAGAPCIGISGWGVPSPTWWVSAYFRRIRCFTFPWDYRIDV